MKICASLLINLHDKCSTASSSLNKEKKLVAEAQSGKPKKTEPLEAASTIYYIDHKNDHKNSRKSLHLMAKRPYLATMVTKIRAQTKILTILVKVI